MAESWAQYSSLIGQVTTGYSQKDHRLQEKRNLFPELAGAGGLYIQKRSAAEDITEEEEEED